MRFTKVWNHPLLVELVNCWKYPMYYIFGRTRIHGVLVKKQALITREILRFIVTGEYEKDEVTLLMDNLTNEERLIEFSSGIGVTSIFAQRNMELQGQILRFDGNDEAIRAAQANAVINECPGIEYRHGAVTSTEKASLAFRQDAQFWASNLSPCHVQGTTPIPAFNLAKILGNFQPTCGIMDIEGGEYELLASEAWQSCLSLKWLIVEFQKTSSSEKTLSDEDELVKRLTQLTEYWQFPTHVRDLARSLQIKPTSAILYPKSIVTCVDA